MTRTRLATRRWRRSAVAYCGELGQGVEGTDDVDRAGGQRGLGVLDQAAAHDDRGRPGAHDPLDGLDAAVGRVRSTRTAPGWCSHDRGLGVRGGADLGGHHEPGAGEQAAQRAGARPAVADHHDDQRRCSAGAARSRGCRSSTSGATPPLRHRGQARDTGRPLLGAVVSPGPALERGRARIRRSCRAPVRPAAPPTPSTRSLHEPVLDWYAEHARDLPWRAPGHLALGGAGQRGDAPADAGRPGRAGLPGLAGTAGRRPAALAAEPPGEAVRAWGRLGYPRRALRLHAAATEVVARHGGELPTTYDGLRALPGVGDYTAAAVASFAHGGRHAVLDTNVRRVLARPVGGEAQPAPALTVAERRRGRGAAARRRRTGRRPLGGRGDGARRAGLHRAVAAAATGCPVADRCAWRLAGRPGVRRTGAGARRPSRAPTGRSAAG